MTDGVVPGPPVTIGCAVIAHPRRGRPARQRRHHDRSSRPRLTAAGHAAGRDRVDLPDGQLRHGRAVPAARSAPPARRPASRSTGQALVRMGDQIPSGPGVLIDPRAARGALRHRRERAVTRRTGAEIDRRPDASSGRDLALVYPGPSGWWEDADLDATLPERAAAGDRRHRASSTASPAADQLFVNRLKTHAGRARRPRPPRVRLAPPRADRPAQRRAHART